MHHTHTHHLLGKYTKQQQQKVYQRLKEEDDILYVLNHCVFDRLISGCLKSIDNNKNYYFFLIDDFENKNLSM